MTSPMSPFGGIHDDERMLDELASRSYVGDDQLGKALNAWACRIDEQAAHAARNAGLEELIRRHADQITAASVATDGLAQGGVAHDSDVMPEPTTIRIRASRLMAGLGGLGVAAAALGIALANGYQVPGLPGPTSEQSSTSVSFDQQLLTQARDIKEQVRSGHMTKQDAVKKITALEAKATDSRVREELQNVKVAVVQDAGRTPSTLPPSPPLPSVVLPPIPAPATTPTTSSATSAPRSSTTSTSTTSSRPSDSSSPGSIPSDATTTPVPSSTTGGTTTATTTSGTRSMPGRPRQSATNSAPGSALSPVPSSRVGATATASVTSHATTTSHVSPVDLPTSP